MALWILIGLFILLAAAWLLAPVSREEGFADTARYPDVFRGVLTHGPSWWTPNYMLGQHLSTMYVAGLSIGLLSLGVKCFGFLVGAMASFKMVVIIFAAGSLIAMHALIRSMEGSRLVGIVGAGFYLLIPVMIVRGPVYEHFGQFMTFIFAPLLFRGIIEVAKKRTPAEIVLLGVAAAGLALSYAKVAVIMAPILALWAWAVLKDREDWQPLVKAYLISLGVAVLCGLVPLLPGIKEFSNAAGFLFDPLDGWKSHYSFKTALSLIDPSNYLLTGLGPDYESDSAFFHMGVVPLLLLSLGLALPGLAEWRKSKIGFWFLILNASWLIGLWFSAGPAGIFGGHLDLLKHAQQMLDTNIPLAWLSLVWLGWVAWLTAKHLFRERVIPAMIVTVAFLMLPVFHVAELLFPMFRDIRAPESFFSTTGFCCLAAATALVSGEIFIQLIPQGRRLTLAAAALAVMLLQLFSMSQIYTSRLLPNEIWKDYSAACEFLKSAPIEGRVHPLSGRYFYLTLPQQAGRAVDTEASGRHFQFKWVRHLEAAGNASGDSLRTYMNVAGVAYVLLDKTDPFSPKQMQDFFRSIYPVTFENNFFAVLANPGTLYPAFLAHDFVALPPESYAMAPAALQLAPQNLITVEMAGVNRNMPGFAGQAKGSNQIELLGQYQGKAGQPFARVPLVGNRMDDYERMSYQLPPTVSGWLVVSEAYHPDWTVTIDGKGSEVHQAEAALLSTYVPAGSHEVVFQFKAPAWYSLCLGLGAINWIAALAALLYLPSKWAPAKWRQWWIGKN
ncbi:MAG: YfhO family protein [Verrucomicrobia bacterium]|nr:YfhO family protein [Verrucomicrobiota bacterium]